MDRLHAVKTSTATLSPVRRAGLAMGLCVGLGTCLAPLAGCDEKPSAEAPRPASSRVNAVAAAAPEEAEAPADFCDVWRDPADTAAGEAATTFTYPPLDAAAPAAGEGWRWINVWATWCKPCVEELPRLAQWESRLSGAGLGDIVFVSVDESAEVVEAFRKDHPEAPASLRVSDPEAIAPWIEGLGLDPGAPLPVHVFVDPDGEVRCLRVAEIADGDYAAVKRLLQGS